MARRCYGSEAQKKKKKKKKKNAERRAMRVVTATKSALLWRLKMAITRALPQDFCRSTASHAAAAADDTPSAMAPADFIRDAAALRARYARIRLCAIARRLRCA